MRKEKKELVRSLVWELASKGRVNKNLLHYPDDIVLLVQEYIKRIIASQADNAEEALPPLIDCGESKGDA